MEEDEAIVQASKLTMKEQALGERQERRDPVLTSWNSHPVRNRASQKRRLPTQKFCCSPSR